MSLRSPLGRVRGLGAAGDAVHHWWVQRLTAIALIPLSVWFTVSLLGLHSYDYATVSAWMSGLWTAIFLVLFVLTAAWHSRLGIQVIIEDYVPDPGTKAVVLVASGFIHIVLALAGVIAIVRMALGST